MTANKNSGDPQKSPPKAFILVVDDEKAVLSLVNAILTEAGYEVTTSSSGYNGYLALEKNFNIPKGAKIDLVITDWMMPGWDGVKLLTEIKKRPYGSTPVILMSGAVTREQLEIAGRSHATAIVIKPIIEEVLLAKVAEVLSKIGS